MVVTGSREHAVRYKQEFDKLVRADLLRYTLERNLLTPDAPSEQDADLRARGLDTSIHI
jgi:hypothetical protein